MDLFLKILGGLFLALIVLVIVGVIAVRLLIRRAFRKLAQSVEGMKYAVQPPRLHLVRDDSLDWNDEAAVDATADALGALGFVDAGTFGTEEMDFLRLHAMAHPAEAVYAAVYEHDLAGVWYDLVTRYEDGTGITHTTAPQGAELDHRPGHDKVYEPGAAPAALFRRHLAERPAKPRKPADPAAFAEVFERAYAEEMDWRNARGGPTEREIRAIAAASGQALDDETLAQVRAQMAEQAMEGLEESLRERFVAGSGLSVAEWEDVRDRLVFVHDRMPPDRVDDLFYSDGDWEGELPAQPPGAPPRRAFAALNDSLPPDRRFRKLGEVAEPVPADVYAAPEPLDDEDDEE